MLELARSQSRCELNGPSVPVVRAPILAHPEQYQLKYQVTSATAKLASPKKPNIARRRSSLVFIALPSREKQA